MIKRRVYYQLFAILFLVLSLQAQESSIDFQARPKTVQIGDKVVLTWNVPRAEAVYLTNVGMVTGKGKIEVTPENRTSTYTLLTEGAPGLRAVDVTIEVTGGKGEAFPQQEEFKHTRTFEITASSQPGLLECFHTVLQDKLGFEVDERYDHRKGKTVFVTKSSGRLDWLQGKSDDVRYRELAYWVEVSDSRSPVGKYTCEIRTYIQYQRRKEKTLRDEAADDIHRESAEKLWGSIQDVVK